MVSLDISFLSILLHAVLDPAPGSLSQLLQLLVALRHALKCLVLRRDVATLLEGRALLELEHPLLQVRELVEVDARPLCGEKSSAKIPTTM